MKTNNRNNHRFNLEIRKPEYAHAYFLELLESSEDDLSVSAILKIIVQKMGVSDFAEFVDAQEGRIVKLLKDRSDLPAELLDKFLRPFGLKTKILVRPIQLSQTH